MRLIILSASILAVASASAVQKPQEKKQDRADMPEIVRFMLRSIPNWKYAGTRLTEIKAGPNRVADQEHVLRDGVKSRTSFAKGSNRYGEVIVESPRERRMYDPKKNTIYVSRGLGMGSDRLQMLARRGSKFVDEKADRVAERDARVVALSDEKGRIHQRIWIDTKSGVILKRELYDHVGARQSYFEFKTIDYSPRFAPGDFTLNVPGAKVMTTYDVAKEQASTIGLTPVFLPRDRFPLDNARVVKSPGGTFLHLTFSTDDGVVSLFQSKGSLPTDRMKGGGNRLNVVAWKVNEVSFALIGRTSSEKLERIARLIGKS